MQVSQQKKYVGLSWLENAPSDWRILRVKQVLSRKNSKASDEEPVVLSLARSGVKIRDITNNEGQLAESYSNYNPVEPGDVLLNPMDLQSGANCSVSHVKGVISPAYVNLRTKSDYDPTYYDYYFKLQYWSRAFFAHGKGVSYDNRWTLNAETILNYPVFVPPSVKQKRIADFLDEETAKIDNLIAKQENLLKLLEEKRRATITHAVTRGLDPKVELNETNIPWLDQIPSHWKIRKLNHLTALLIGSTPSTQNPDDFDGSEVWVTIADMKERIVMDSKQKLTGEAAANKNMKKVPKGSVLFSFKLSVGKVAYCGIDLYTNEAIAAFVPKRDITSEFLYYASQSYFINEAGENIYGAAIFNQELLKAVHIATPPEDEQYIIAKYLDKENIIFNELRDKIMEQILLLKERRTSLISHAVTGKIMV